MSIVTPPSPRPWLGLGLGAALATLAVAATTALWSSAVRAAVPMPIGDARYEWAFREIVDTDPTAGFLPQSQLVVTDRQAGGALDEVHTMGRSALGRPARLHAGAYDRSDTFWSAALSPSFGGRNAVLGGVSTLVVSQSFRKSAVDASLSFVFTGGTMQLMDFGAGTPDDRNLSAKLGFSAMLLDNATGRVLWAEEQTARIRRQARDPAVRNDALWSPVLTTQSSRAGSPPITPWAWDCTECGNAAGGFNVAALRTPYSGAVDLSGVAVGSNVTAVFRVTTRVIDARQGETSAFAYLRDPLQGGGSGGSYFYSSLEPTGDPLPSPLPAVPELGTAGLMAAGLALFTAVALRRRKG